MDFVYRRPFDFRAPKPSWLLLRPDLNVTAGVNALAVTPHNATITGGRKITATVAAIGVSGQQASITTGHTLTANVGAMTAGGNQATVAFLDTTAFTFRDQAPPLPVTKAGVFRADYVTRRPRAPTIIPRRVSSGDIAANRVPIAVTGLTASVQFDASIQLWVLYEALRQAAARRNFIVQTPADRSAWGVNQGIGQFTISKSELTAYTRPLIMTAQQASAVLSRANAAQLVTLAMGHPQAAVRLGKSITALVRSITMTGLTARIGTGRTAAATVAAITMAGQASAALLSRDVAANTGHLTMATLGASFGNHLNVAARVSVMAITPEAATAHLGKAIAALAANLSLTALSAGSHVHLDIAALTAHLSISGKSATPHFQRIVLAAIAQLTFVQQQALIEGTKAVIVTVGRRTIVVRARNSTITVH